MPLPATLKTPFVEAPGKPGKFKALVSRNGAKKASGCLKNGHCQGHLAIYEVSDHYDICAVLAGQLQWQICGQQGARRGF
jgi:hypothetical protein